MLRMEQHRSSWNETRSSVYIVESRGLWGRCDVSRKPVTYRRFTGARIDSPREYLQKCTVKDEWLEFVPNCLKLRFREVATALTRRSQGSLLQMEER